jgi:hypothetical protein
VRLLAKSVKPELICRTGAHERVMSSNLVALFWEYMLHDVTANAEQHMFAEIDELDANATLNTNPDELCKYFEQKYGIHVPRLRESEISVDQEEAKVDVSHDFNRLFFEPGPHFVTGTAFTYYVPFEGESGVFRIRPSHFSQNPVRAIIHENEFVITYTRADHNVVLIKAEFDKSLRAIRDCLETLRNELTPFNSSLISKARARIDARRKKLLDDRGAAADLGYPLRRRADAPETYVAPGVRRKPIPVRPSARPESSTPEPVLNTIEYEHILDVISSMVHVIERSPHAFQGMKEEDLRQHFLVQLNGQYEGQATGETFNVSGKTDILIRAGDKNVFIAECKFWEGPESLLKAIDQLLGYSSWRDTKTALLVFNRDRQLSTVLAKIQGVAKQHPNFKRQLEYKSETGFRFVLQHRDDVARELILTILVFEVPA